MCIAHFHQQESGSEKFYCQILNSFITLGNCFITLCNRMITHTSEHAINNNKHDLVIKKNHTRHIIKRKPAIKNKALLAQEYSVRENDKKHNQQLGIIIV